MNFRVKKNIVSGKNGFNQKQNRRRMRLIDADDLIAYLNDYARQETSYSDEDNADIRDVIQECIEAVEEQPTAYDIDKVVERLKEEAKYSHADYLEYARKHGFDEDTDYHFAGLEIVEPGASLDGEHIRSDVEESAIKNHIMQRFMRKE